LFVPPIPRQTTLLLSTTDARWAVERIMAIPSQVCHSLHGITDAMHGSVHKVPATFTNHNLVHSLFSIKGLLSAGWPIACTQ
jgi:hypothetical protein